MQSTLKLRESDPHDVFTIAPEIVPAAWADKVLADITRDTSRDASDQPPQAESGTTAIAPAPTVDMNFRTTPANDIHAQTVHVPNVDVSGERPAGPPPTGSWARSTIIAFMFALCSAFAAAGWQHYGAAAKQMISAWMPPFTLTTSAPEPTGLAAQPDTAAVEVPAQASTADQAPPQPAQAQAPEGAAPAAIAPSADSAQFQSMARDLAAMGQEVELLKATVAELKSAQQPVARDAANTSAIKTSATKPAVPNPRPRISVPPPRAAAASPRKPMQATPVQAYRTQAYPAQGYPTQAYPPAPAPPPMPLPPSASLQPAPMAMPSDDGPVIRPPMPLQ